MNKDQFITLAGKIADGTASKSEESLFDNYYSAFQQKEWSSEEFAVLNSIKPKLWNSISSTIGMKEQEPDDQHGSKVRSISSWLKVAASVTLIAAASWFIFKNRSDDQRLIATVVTEKAEITTDHGQVKQLNLPDGSVIWLNAVSTVSYPEKFTGSTREITLEGEAYLEVAHDSDKPFIVRTGNISTRVLGTRFNIKAYREDQSIEVVVVEGKVKVSDGPDSSVGQSVELSANQKAVFNKSHAILAQQPVDATAYNSWTEGKLIFKKTPLQDVMRALERKYGITISYDQAMANCPVFANLQDETAIDAIELIAISVGAKMEQNDEKQFTLRGGVCQ